MTVSASTSRADYNGNGSTTAFSVPFYFLDNTHLSVIKTSSAGVATTLVLTTDYTVSGAGVGAGGTVTTVVAPASGERLSILRNVPLDQQTNYVANDPFPAESHEAALDKLTMISQQLSEGLNRSLSLSANSSGVSALLPSAQADAAIGWNGSGTALVNLTPQTSLFAVPQTVVSGSAVLPKGTTAQRDSSPLSGYFRFNTTINQFEGYNGTVWGSVGGGATGGGSDAIFYLNDQTVNNDYTIAATQNAMSAGPISIATGKTVTVSSGAVWTIV